jgi:uncharacterized protein (DUF2235 family)
MPLYAFNGTWNAEKTEDLQTSLRESDANTNVIRFRDAYRGAQTFYRDGVGTRLSWIGKLVGGAFGAGGFTRLGEAMDHLKARRAAGDRDIDIVGFSRGAALALAFANKINASRELRDTHGRPPRIRFLGLFDVVGAFGVPVNLGPLRFQEYNVGFRLSLPPNVEHCFHALALDERRQAFRVTRVEGAYEVWFRGAHSDVGGGNGNHGLNAIAGTWMLRKAFACGLPIREPHILELAGSARPDAVPIWASFDPVKNRFRTCRPDDRIHHTVAIPSGHRDCNDPPASCVREDAAAELVAVRSALFQG